MDITEYLQKHDCPHLTQGGFDKIVELVRDRKRVSNKLNSYLNILGDILNSENTIQRISYDILTHYVNELWIESVQNFDGKLSEEREKAKEFLINLRYFYDDDINKNIDKYMDLRMGGAYTMNWLINDILYNTNS